MTWFNVSALSEVRFHERVKVGAVLCARSIEPFERSRPRPPSQQALSGSNPQLLQVHQRAVSGRLLYGNYPETGLWDVALQASGAVSEHFLGAGLGAASEESMAPVFLQAAPDRALRFLTSSAPVVAIAPRPEFSGRPG